MSTLKARWRQRRLLKRQQSDGPSSLVFSSPDPFPFPLPPSPSIIIPSPGQLPPSPSVTSPIGPSTPIPAPDLRHTVVVSVRSAPAVSPTREVESESECRQKKQSRVRALTTGWRCRPPSTDKRRSAPVFCRDCNQWEEEDDEIYGVYKYGGDKRMRGLVVFSDGSGSDMTMAEEGNVNKSFSARVEEARRSPFLKRIRGIMLPKLSTSTKPSAKALGKAPDCSPYRAPSYIEDPDDERERWEVEEDTWVREREGIQRYYEECNRRDPGKEGQSSRDPLRDERQADQLERERPQGPGKSTWEDMPRAEQPEREQLRRLDKWTWETASRDRPGGGPNARGRFGDVSPTSPCSGGIHRGGWR